jgi:hypothetical protein
LSRAEHRPVGLPRWRASPQFDNPRKSCWMMPRPHLRVAPAIASRGDSPVHAAVPAGRGHVRGHGPPATWTVDSPASTSNSTPIPGRAHTEQRVTEQRPPGKLCWQSISVRVVAIPPAVHRLIRHKGLPPVSGAGANPPRSSACPPSPASRGGKSPDTPSECAEDAAIQRPQQIRQPRRDRVEAIPSSAFRRLHIVER